MVRMQRQRVPPAPLLLSIAIVLLLFFVALQHQGPRMHANELELKYNYVTTGKGDVDVRNIGPKPVEIRKGVTEEAELEEAKDQDRDPMKCMKEQPWIDIALDYFFTAAREQAERHKNKDSEQALLDMMNLKWANGYTPGHELMTLTYDGDSDAYKMTVEERSPANKEHKARCIRLVLQQAIDKHGRDLARYFDQKTIKFVVETEDFGMIFRNSQYKLPAFALSTDAGKIDIPVPDFTFGCYPEAKYTNTSWPAIRDLLYMKSTMLPWNDRADQIFHRSNWGVGPRRGLMPFLEDLKNNKTDKKILGARLNIGNTEFEASNKMNFVPLDEQCKYKVQIHTAGFSYSAGLKYKLACGSLVIKFTSEFTEFFEPAIRDSVHVVEAAATHDGVNRDAFLSEAAPRIKQAVQNNMEEPHQIARAGQEFVMKNLTSEALSCYWYAALLRYGRLYLS